MKNEFIRPEIPKLSSHDEILCIDFKIIDDDAFSVKNSKGFWALRWRNVIHLKHIIHDTNCKGLTGKIPSLSALEKIYKYNKTALCE